MRASLSILAILALLLTAPGDLAAGELPSVGVGAFAAVRAEFTASHGGILTGDNAAPRVMEYRRLTEWDPHEPSTSPGLFDVVALVSNRRSTALDDVVLEIEVRAKVGPLLLLEPADAPDLAEGRRRAEWAPTPLAFKTIRLGTLGADETRSVALKEINLESYALDLHVKGVWPYFVEMIAKARCAGCEAPVVARSQFEMNPGD